MGEWLEFVYRVRFCEVKVGVSGECGLLLGRFIWVCYKSGGFSGSMWVFGIRDNLV